MRTLLPAFFAGVALAATNSDPGLIKAVKVGDKTQVAALVQRHVDVNAPEADGTTALMWAVRSSFGKDDTEIAELLIRAGADVKAANRYRISALYLACQNGNA